MNGQGATTHWRRRLIDRMVFDSVWERGGHQQSAGRRRIAGRALYGGHGPALMVCVVVAAGVVAPGWMLVLGAITSVPRWAMLLGATAATVLAGVAVTVATDLQRTLIREIRDLRSSHVDCRCCRTPRPQRLSRW